jgi:endonuclease-3
MSTNRAALLTKVHKALKKHYASITPRGEQPLLEALLFACCLENTHAVTAEKVYEVLRTSFYDWNEVRVTTIKELSEVLVQLPDPAAAAAHVKNILQTVFESEYSFELESLKKQNIGQAVKHMQKLEGVTPFIVAYATQMALDGHSIPLDRGASLALVVLGAATQAEADSGTVSGLERAIPKSKGHEFGALLHELGADFVTNPFSPALRELVLSIAPDAKDRMPKRGVKKPEPEPVKPDPSKKGESLKKKDEKPAAPVVGKKKDVRGPMTPGAKNGATTKPETPAPPAKPAMAAKPAAKKPTPPPTPPAKKKVLSKPLAKRKPR